MSGALASALDQLEFLELGENRRPRSRAAEQSAALLALSSVPSIIRGRVRLHSGGHGRSSNSRCMHIIPCSPPHSQPSGLRWPLARGGRRTWDDVIDVLQRYATYGLIEKPAARVTGVAITAAGAKLYRGLFDVLASLIAAAEADTSGLPGSAASGPALRRGYGIIIELCLLLLTPTLPAYRVVGTAAAAFLNSQLLARPGAVASGESSEGQVGLRLREGETPCLPPWSVCSPAQAARRADHGPHRPCP